MMPTIPARVVDTLLGMFGDNWNPDHDPTTTEVREQADRLRASAVGDRSVWGRTSDAEGRALEALADYYDMAH